MLFSEAFGYTGSPSDDWFDPILTVDTCLFVDPFLMFLDDDPRWERAHESVVNHFDRAFQLLAESDSNPQHVKYKAALSLLTFPEPHEFCLGYTADSTRGAGSGAGIARAMAEAMSDAISRGVTSLAHFEELGIFNERISPDRISDIVCTILKPDFAQYTTDVCSAASIPIHETKVRACGFDPLRLSGPATGIHQLPLNPDNGKPVILVPSRFLKDLPTLNADDWFNSSEAAHLRAELNVDVMTKVRKADIVRIARRNPDSVARWRDRLESDRDAEPYDLNADPRGVYQWYAAARQFSVQNPFPVTPPANLEEFLALIEKFIERFQHFVEQKGGWRLLWNEDGKEKREEAAQLLFLGVVSADCESHDIVVDREVQLGRGSVDFKFSNGYSERALIEVKKVHNGRFWNGLEDQLPSYMKSDRCDSGWFVAIQYRNDGVSKGRGVELPVRIKKAREETGYEFRYRLIDARPKTSASKLT